MNPYIGITDFMNFEQVKQMLAVFKKHKKKGSKRKLHVGVMMSYKTLHELPTKWSGAFPSNNKIKEIFGSTEVYNCLHYVDYENRPNLHGHITLALSVSGFNTDALQLDMVWPDPVEIANGIHTSRRCVDVILQISKNALDLVDNDPMNLVEKLSEYQSVIQGVLIDKSMGKGVCMNHQELYPFIHAIADYYPDMAIGIAGGLGPDTMHLIDPLIKGFPELNIDAQGRLRPSGSALDPIDWDMASTYLIKALDKLS